MNRIGGAFTAIIAIGSFFFIGPILMTMAYAIGGIIAAAFSLTFACLQLVIAIALVWMLSTLFRRYVLKETKERETESIAEWLWKRNKARKARRKARR